MAEWRQFVRFPRGKNQGKRVLMYWPAQHGKPEAFGLVDPWTYFMGFGGDWPTHWKRVSAAELAGDFTPPGRATLRTRALAQGDRLLNWLSPVDYLGETPYPLLDQIAWLIRRPWRRAEPVMEPIPFTMEDETPF